MSVSLGSKESGLFKSAIRFYENKQYKQGLRACEQILKKYPHHGETLALKGLFTLFLGNRDEGFDICKSGLKLSLQSHVSWHVLGLMYRQDKNYDEAIKCYKSALRLDKDNFQILRDMALLQMQVRQLDGALETRKRLIFIRPSSPFNWISAIITAHLAGLVCEAIELTDIYMNLFQQLQYNNDELLYYKCMVLMEGKFYPQALSCLEGFKKQTSTKYLELKANCLLSLDSFKDAMPIIDQLVEKNPENMTYLSWAIGTIVKLDEDMDSFIAKIISKSQLGSFAMLPLLPPKWRLTLLAQIFESALMSSPQGLFFILRDLLKQDDVADLVRTILEKLEPNFSVFVFTANFCHFMGNFEEAFQAVCSALSSKPDCFELLELKSNILIGLDRTLEALDELKEKKDSFIGDKNAASAYVKLLIRHGSISMAQEIAASFIQKSTFQQNIMDLHEMQANWYLNEMADRMFKDGKYQDAYCFYRKIESVFAEYVDDQLDFQGFALRRNSLCEYVKMLRFLDADAFKNSYFNASLLGQLKCLLQFHNMPADDLACGMDSLTLNKREFVDDLESERKALSTVSKASNLVPECLRIAKRLLSIDSKCGLNLTYAAKVAIMSNSRLLAQKLKPFLDSSFEQYKELSHLSECADNLIS